MTLEPLHETCVPRADVKAGTVSAIDFAARLEQVVADPDTYADYGDPVRFFSLTHPTSGMKRLLTSVFGRLSEQDVPGAENPILRFQTSFGGGKTHGLIAAYHVARGYRPGSDFFDPGLDESLIPTDTQVAAVVGEQLDPVNGVDIAGTTAFTLWGAIAAQLGPQAWEVAKKSDAARTPPGTGTIKKMLASGRRSSSSTRSPITCVPFRPPPQSRSGPWPPASPPSSNHSSRSRRRREAGW